MKTKFLFLFLFGMSTFIGTAQSPLPSSICKEFRPSGWIFFKPGTLSNGEMFTVHKPCFFSQPEDSMVNDRNWTDNQAFLNHSHYQQTYHGIEVEYAEFIEHYHSNGDMIYANGKICAGIHTRYNPKYMTEEVAFSNLLAHYEGYYFAWMDPQWEAGIKIDHSDPTATYLPTGQLVFAFEKFGTPQYQMNPEDYRMAWRFDVRCLSPDSHFVVYVDAITGEVFKEIDQRHYDTSADIMNYGTKTIDSRWVGWPTSAHRLHTNDNARNVHTKDHDGSYWIFTDEVENSSTSWGTTNQLSTTAHWLVTQAWDYFTNVHGREGMKNNNKVRVFADYTGDGEDFAAYDRYGGNDYIYFGYTGAGTIYPADLSIIGHEFSHGVDEYEGKLEYVYESGALDESFADIFGFLTRRYIQGSSSWVIGLPTVALTQRNLQNPKSSGLHLEFVTDTTLEWFTGQPDTYNGEFWFPDSLFNDNGGVHINSGVQNHWFYLLSVGGSGVNDNSDSYAVSGIGIDNAAEIAYYNFVNNMEKHSTYEDAREGAITSAEILFGECSFEHIQTTIAWYAVGVGAFSTCEGASIKENQFEIKAYPNPTTDFITFEFENLNIQHVEVYSVTGEIIYSVYGTINGNYTIDVSTISSGTYFIRAIGDEIYQSKFIKK